MDPERWQRTKALFDAALAVPRERRDAFLDDACAGDPELRTEVASLLASHRDDSFLKVPAAALDVEARDRERRALIGHRIGPYEVSELIGYGGMGVVYLGHDTRLNRAVAIKALLPEHTRDPARRARLAREARAAAVLSHPGIATVYALEELDDRVFIVGEYVQGETLREELVRGPLRPERLVETALTIARALAAAHARGVVHRDLKPENVMRAADGQVKILDFGLAHFAEPDGRTKSVTTQLTESGVALGTPAYMSPEQIRGGTLDFRTDLFSFGVMVHELATGVHPFGGSDTLSTIGRILEDEPPALTGRPDVPPALVGILDRCLRKTPAERYRTTGDLVSDLELLEQNVRSRERGPVPAASRYRFEEPTHDILTPIRWWRVHQAAVGIAPCLLLLPLWRVQSWTPGLEGLALFVMSSAAAVALATLRFHLWFTSRFYPAELRAQRARVRFWILAAELVYLLLLITAAALVAGSHRAFAALLASAGVVLALASAIIEPATTRAAFGSED